MNWILSVSAMGFPALLLLGLGVMLRRGHGYEMMKSYARLNSEERAMVDAAGMARLNSSGMFVLAGLIALAGVMMRFNQVAGMLVALLAIVPVTLFWVLRERKFLEHLPKRNRSSLDWDPRVKAILIGFFVIVFGGLMGLLLYFSAKPADVSVDQGVLKVTGMYGKSFLLADAQKTEVITTMPEVQNKRDGSALGSKLKGRFTVEGYGNVRLLLDTQAPPFVVLYMKDETVLVSGKDTKDSQRIADEVMRAEGK